MTSPAETLNTASNGQAKELLTRCCGATRWVRTMLALRPFASDDTLYLAAESVWNALAEDDYREAFGHHPQIAEDLTALREKFQSTADWSKSEQAGVARADDATLEALRSANAAYRARFGFIFIVCATGKSAEELLRLLEARLDHSAAEEIAIAAAEQTKITLLRLQKLGS